MIIISLRLVLVLLIVLLVLVHQALLPYLLHEPVGGGKGGEGSGNFSIEAQ